MAITAMTTNSSINVNAVAAPAPRFSQRNLLDCLRASFSWLSDTLTRSGESVDGVRSPPNEKRQPREAAATDGRKLAD